MLAVARLAGSDGLSHMEEMDGDVREDEDGYAKRCLPEQVPDQESDRGSGQDSVKREAGNDAGFSEPFAFKADCDRKPELAVGRTAFVKQAQEVEPATFGGVGRLAGSQTRLRAFSLLALVAACAWLRRQVPEQGCLYGGCTMDFKYDFDRKVLEEYV